MAFRWCADDGPTLIVGLEALRFNQGIRNSKEGNPIFCDFSGGGSLLTVPPSGSTHDMHAMFSLWHNKLLHKLEDMLNT